MIIGVGSDIIDITRIENTIKRFGNRFINRCFTKIEIDKSNQRNIDLHHLQKDLQLKRHFQKHLEQVFHKVYFLKILELLIILMGSQI